MPEDHPPPEEGPSPDPSALLAPPESLANLQSSTTAPSSALGHDTAVAGDEPSQDALATAARPQTDAKGRPLNPRSCVTCRKRKVKCDRVHPCNHCSRARIECIFPAPGRAPRRPRKPGEGRDRELLERLRRLEGVVKGMGVEVSDATKVPNAHQEEAQELRARSGSSDLEHTKQSPPDNLKESHPKQNCNTNHDFQRKTMWVEEQQKGRFENKFGRLVVNEGKSRYINNSFWANLSNEVEDLKGILNQSSDEEDDASSSPRPQPPLPSTHHGFVFGFSSQNVDLLSLHPLPGQISEYWDIYKDRVDPLCKILHVPTLEPTVLSAASHLSNLSRGFECLLFAMYYAATTSLAGHDCFIKLGEEKTILLARYRFAVEQALARANFLTTEEIVVLQSFVVFLICLRRNNDARVIWTLTGLIVRIAQTIGIHRDGSHFGLAPFEIEMRRRLWWQVCILDTRASEDHGCDPTIIEQSFDTKMPLNINDEDLSPKMKELPRERQGCTEMSFCLLRYEVSNTFRRINYIPPGPPRACNEFLSSVTLEDKERWITECHQRLEEKYLKNCDMSVPLFWVTATVGRLMMSKMWLMVYHPFQREDGGASLSEDVKDKLFITSLENMEYSLLLETETRTMKWGWLFKTYVQWHALAFTLSELSHRTTGELVERAWIAVEKTRDGRWGIHATEESNTGHLWRPLKRLYRKAKEARMRGLQGEQIANGRRTSNPPVRTYSPNANPMFGHPSRPRMTRAPLSSAQLKRFTDGPSYGQTPLDKHELLRSPKLSEASDIDPMETAGLSQDILQPLLPQELDQNLAGAQSRSMNDVQFSAAPSVQQIAMPQAQYPERQDSSAGGLALNQLNASKGSGPENFAVHENMRSNLANLHSGGNDMSAMDTSADMNWENWDQLVRQFGMDIDSDLNVPLWNAPTWETGTSAQRMGFGPGGGDWF